MGKVVSHMTMLLDVFIADPQDGVAELSGWYEAGTVIRKDCFDQNSASRGATVTRSFTASASCRSSVIKASASSWVRATYSASNVSGHQPVGDLPCYVLKLWSSCSRIRIPRA